MVCLDCWVPMRHSWGTIPDITLHPLDWFGHLWNDTAITKNRLRLLPKSFTIKPGKEGRCQIPFSLSSLCNAVMTIPSLLPHLIQVSAFSMILGVTPQHAYTLSQALARVLSQPVLQENALILIHSLVSKFISHPPLSGPLRVQSQAYCPSWLVLKLDSRNNSSFPPLAIEAGPWQSYFMT